MTPPKPPPGAASLLANLARAAGSAATIAKLMAEKPVAPPLPGIGHVALEQMAKSLGKVARAYAARPDKLVAANLDFAQAQARLVGLGLRRLTGGDASPLAAPPAPPAPAPPAPAPTAPTAAAAGDRRFADPDWRDNPLLDLLKQSYLVTARWAGELVDNADGLDAHTRRQARFAVSQIANALSPTNFPLTNPQAMRAALASAGESLADGLGNLAADIAASDGELRVPQTDVAAFEIGRDLATTPGKIVLQNDLMQLIQYAPATRSVSARPLLIVPPWINKFYILDLTPQKSFVAWAVAQGLTVFVVSWVNPDARCAGKSFADYMREGVLAALDAIAEATGERNVNALGYCIGGTLLAATLAYMAAVGDDRVRSASFLGAQVDFEEAGELLVFVDEAQAQGLERHMAAKGYLEGRKMAQTFSFLRANELIWASAIEAYLKGKSPPPFDILYWNSDPTRMPAAMLSFYLRECYMHNALSAGRMVLDGVRIDLKRISIPIYNLAPRDDHIAPLASVFKLGRHVSGDTRLVVAGSGHVAGIVNPPAAGKYGYWTNDSQAATPDEWLAAAIRHPGSWWPDWHAWLKAHGGPPVAPSQPGDGKLTPLEDAPGSYVKLRAE